jgi:hypothetical protein
MTDTANSCGGSDDSTTQYKNALRQQMVKNVQLLCSVSMWNVRPQHGDCMTQIFCFQSDCYLITNRQLNIWYLVCTNIPEIQHEMLNQQLQTL